MNESCLYDNTLKHMETKHEFSGVTYHGIGAHDRVGEAAVKQLQRQHRTGYRPQI